MSNDNEFWYPTKEDIVEIHDDIIEDDSESEAGIENPERIEYVVEFIKHGHFGEGPETVHEKAFDLMRLIAANHWFVDGNKRTALNTTELFYFFNGYEFKYGEDIRSMLKLFSVREDLIDRSVGVQYLADQTSTITVEDLDTFELLAILLETIDLEELLGGFERTREDQWEFPSVSESTYLQEYSLSSENQKDDHND